MKTRLSSLIGVVAITALMSVAVSSLTPLPITDY